MDQIPIFDLIVRIVPARLSRSFSVPLTFSQPTFYALPTHDVRVASVSTDHRLQRLVPDPVRLVGVHPQPLLALGFVGLVVAVAPDDPAVALEGEDVRGDPVEEPAVVADDHGAAAEVEQRLFEGPQHVDIEIVGRLVEQQQVAAALRAAWPGGRGSARRRRALPTFFSWSGPLKLNWAT